MKNLLRSSPPQKKKDDETAVLKRKLRELSSPDVENLRSILRGDRVVKKKTPLMLNSGIARINDESLYVQVERMRKYLNEQKSAHEQSLKEMYAEVDSCKHKLEEANGKLEKEQTRRRKLQLELDSSIKTYNDLKLTQINSPVSASRQGRSFFFAPR